MERREQFFRDDGQRVIEIKMSASTSPRFLDEAVGVDRRRLRACPSWRPETRPASRDSLADDALWLAVRMVELAELTGRNAYLQELGMSDSTRHRHEGPMPRETEWPSFPAGAAISDPTEFHIDSRACMGPSASSLAHRLCFTKVEN